MCMRVQGDSFQDCSQTDADPWGRTEGGDDDDG